LIVFKENGIVGSIEINHCLIAISLTSPSIMVKARISPHRSGKTDDHINSIIVKSEFISFAEDMPGDWD